MSKIKGSDLLSMTVEPRMSGEITKLDLLRILNWYAANAESKDYLKWITSYFKKNHKVDISSVVNEQYRTFGHVCRIVSHGGELPNENREWFEKQSKELLDKIQEKNKKKKEPVNVQQTVDKPNIQDRIAEKISELIADLDGSFDDYLESEFKTEPKSMSILANRMKSAYANKLIDFCEKKRDEYEEALSSLDPQVQEGYSNFKKPQLKKMVAYASSIIADIQTLAGAAAKARKPRKKKVIPVSQIVSKVKYQKEFAELNLTSVDPKELVGSTQIWVYNTKQRKLGCYHVDSTFGGMTVKGTSILNYDVTKSISKKLRKPAQVLPEILKGGKIFLRTALQNINATDNLLSGRLNEDTIILRVIK